MLASEEGHTQVLRLLHEKGADRKLATTVSVRQVHFIIIIIIIIIIISGCSLLCHLPILLFDMFMCRM